MTTHELNPMDGEVSKPPPQRSENLCRNFDAEVHLPTDISPEFLSAALLWAIQNKVDFGLFHEADRIIIFPQTPIPLPWGQIDDWASHAIAPSVPRAIPRSGEMLVDQNLAE
ncbi:hypothetical protein [Rhizobium sp. 007]|uniref:hypothetical protein n=1 Tax=Rhizobium sp. 007 TaxID=2785056 RepID=UPI001FEFFAD1|nr:hypothetical protein [Rhizobium sp. 007]